MGEFFRQAARLGDRPLVFHHQEGEWQPVRWSEMSSRSLALAGHLIEAGVKHGDRVLLMSANCVEWLYADLAIQTVGAIPVPVYPSTTAEVAEQIAKNSRAVLAIVADAKMAAKLDGKGTLKQVVRIDGELRRWIAKEPSPELMRKIEARARKVAPEDLATIVYTSGTTGQPKGVMLTHQAITDMVDSSLEAFPVGEDDVALSFLPYAHIFERVSGTYVGVRSGATGYLARGMDNLMADLKEVRPTLMCAVPRVFEKMHAAVMAQVDHAAPHRRALFHWALRQGSRGGPLKRVADRLVLKPLRDHLTGGRLRYFVSGGAPLAEHVEEFFWSVGIPVLQGWGMTETSSGGTANTLTKHRVGTVGRALPGVELKIAEDGEVLIKSPGNMTGYYRDEKATSEILGAGGWLHTGDIGELDRGGYLKITDRKKDLIKTAGGKYVAPQPLEAKLQDDPLIERAVVIGDQRPFVTALIVPDWEAVRTRLGVAGEAEKLTSNPKVNAAIQKRVDEVNSKLGSWEQIKYFALLAEDFSEERGEITPSLKVKRRVVQQGYQQQIDEMYSRTREPAGKTG